MNSLIYFNGQLIPADTPIVGASNRGLRYGDGLFETIRQVDGEMPLFELHMERLFKGLQTLQMNLAPSYTQHYLEHQIRLLCQHNGCTPAARVRLSVFRGNGTLYSVTDEYASIVIQAESLPDLYSHLNEKGWHIDVYPDAKKSCDKLANLKSNNYLTYIMAAQYAQHNHLNDCLVLNSHDRICDATIANIFWIKGDTIYTPPLSEGCVAGVMRRYLIEHLSSVKEIVCTDDELLNADEVFLTNAVYGMRWVQQFRNKTYSNYTINEIYSGIPFYANQR